MISSYGGERALATARKPLSPQHKLKILEVDIITVPDRCKGCELCIELCPKDVLDHDPKLNVHGVHPPVVVNEDDCVGCGLCEQICPDLAIFVRKKEEDKC